MTDVHEAYVERRRWRIWPFVLLVLVALFGIGLLVAMIMNIHGSITWPAGEVRFGFWPRETTTSVAAPEIAAPPARVATEIPLTPAPQLQQAQPAQPESPPAATSPSEPDTAPTENVPVE
jgi:hypothetical protein